MHNKEKLSVFDIMRFSGVLLAAIEDSGAVTQLADIPVRLRCKSAGPEPLVIEMKLNKETKELEFWYDY